MHGVAPKRAPKTLPHCRCYCFAQGKFNFGKRVLDSTRGDCEVQLPGTPKRSIIGCYCLPIQSRFERCCFPKYLRRPFSHPPHSMDAGPSTAPHPSLHLSPHLRRAALGVMLLGLGVTLPYLGASSRLGVLSARATAQPQRNPR